MKKLLVQGRFNSFLLLFFFVTTTIEQMAVGNLWAILGILASLGTVFDIINFNKAIKDCPDKEVTNG